MLTDMKPVLGRAELLIDGVSRISVATPMM
jgi:hypothetical protein